MSSSILSRQLGPVLLDLETRTKAIINHATQKGDLLVANACTKVERSIINARLELFDSLDTTIDKVNEKSQDFFLKLEMVVQQFEANTMSNMKIVGSMLPFAGKQPQVVDIKGAVVARSLIIGDSFKITIIGHFPEIGKMKPTLELNGRQLNPKEEEDSSKVNESEDFSDEEEIIEKAETPPTSNANSWFYSTIRLAGLVGLAVLIKNYMTSDEDKDPVIIKTAAVFCVASALICLDREAKRLKNKTILNVTHATQQGLTFEVPIKMLTPSIIVGKISFTSGTLQFPRGLLTANDTFPILITELPDSPGTIELETTFPGVQINEIERETYSTEVELRSSRTEHRGDQESRIFIQAPAGWKLDFHNARIETPTIETGRKDYKSLPKPDGGFGRSYGHERITATEDRVEYKIWTKAKGRRESGWVVYRLQCEATKCSSTTMPAQIKSKSYNLQWGEFIVKDVPSDFKVIFHPFDRVHTELVSPTLSNRFIEVKKIEGKKIQIRAKRLDEIENLF